MGIFSRWLRSTGANSRLVSGKLSMNTHKKDDGGSGKADESKRTVFSEDALICISGTSSPKWLRVRDCLWSSDSEIQGKTTLDTAYGDLEDFFVNILGVDTLNISVICKDLGMLSQSSRATRVADVKSKLWILNSMLKACDGDAEVDPSYWMDQHILPVRLPDGRVELLSADHEFYVLDRKHLEGGFRDKVRSFDFTYDEVLQLRPLIEWLRLQVRNISDHVEEITTISAGHDQPMSATDCVIRARAHALCR